MHADTARTRNPLATTLTIGAAALLSLALVAAMVFTVTQAAFTDTTSNEDNSWAAGEVDIDEGNAGVAVFDAENIVPGYSDDQTITVTNNSTVATTVVFSADLGEGNGALKNYLDVLITTDGGTVEVYNGKLSDIEDDLDHAAANLATGDLDEDPTSAEYVISVLFPTGQDANDAQGTSADVSFTWTATSVVPTP